MKIATLLSLMLASVAVAAPAAAAPPNFRELSETAARDSVDTDDAARISSKMMEGREETNSDQGTTGPGNAESVPPLLGGRSDVSADQRTASKANSAQPPPLFGSG